MTELEQIPELQALTGPSFSLRIPDQLDIPLTDRVQRLIDTADFRRLADVPQLGLVSLVYPGATHTRFEHSLGVYRNALHFLKHLAGTSEFAERVNVHQIQTLLVAALLHDIGHWPFCHPIEDMNLPGILHHEQRASALMEAGDIAPLLQSDWGIQPDEVFQLLNGPSNDGERVLSSVLSGPIDIDKMDYLYRDSHHAGVPYGKNFDAPRLINSLCLNQSKDGIAITSKGKTAAEFMVFARYVMFSEVYWHHAVRSATAMFQNAFFFWHQQNSGNDSWYEWSEADWYQEFLSDQSPGETRHLAAGIFGARRRLYKRLAAWTYSDKKSLYQAIAHRPFDWLIQVSAKIASRLSQKKGLNLSPADVIIDAPPVGLEVQFKVDVLDPVSNQFQNLDQISPVVHALANRQFDHFVKQVRLFVHPRVVDQIRDVDVEEILMELV